MQPSKERRRWGTKRRNYPVVRLYAKMMSWSSVAVLVVGIVLGVLMIVFAEQPLWLGSSNGFLVIAAGALYFIIARGVAEILYLLLDMARNSYTSRPASADNPSNSV